MNKQIRSQNDSLMEFANININSKCHIGSEFWLLFSSIIIKIIKQFYLLQFYCNFIATAVVDQSQTDHSMTINRNIQLLNSMELTFA